MFKKLRSNIEKRKIAREVRLYWDEVRYIDSKYEGVSLFVRGLVMLSGYDVKTDDITLSFAAKERRIAFFKFLNIDYTGDYYG